MSLLLFSQNIIYSNLSFHLLGMPKKKAKKKKKVLPLSPLLPRLQKQSPLNDHGILSCRAWLLPQNLSQNNLLGNCHQIIGNNAQNEICSSPSVFTPELFCQPYLSIPHSLRNRIKVILLCTISDICGCLARLH